MLCWTRSEVLSSQPPAHASSFPLTLPAPLRWSPPVKSWVLGSPTIFHPPKLQKRLLLYFTGLPPSQSKTGGGRQGEGSLLLEVKWLPQGLIRRGRGRTRKRPKCKWGILHFMFLNPEEQAPGSPGILNLLSGPRLQHRLTVWPFC